MRKVIRAELDGMVFIPGVGNKSNLGPTLSAENLPGIEMHMEGSYLQCTYRGIDFAVRLPRSITYAKEDKKDAAGTASSKSAPPGSQTSKPTAKS